MAVIWAIARKEIFSTYTNRNFVLLILVTPLVLAVLLGALSSGLSSPDAAVWDVPLVIVNLDEGNGGVNFGQVFVSLLVRGAGQDNPLGIQDAACATSQTEGAAVGVSLADLTNTVQMDDPDAVRSAVERGEFAAAIIIPRDFSRKLGYTPAHRAVEAVEVEVYADSGQSVSALVARGIAEAILSQLVTGNIAIAATVDSLEERFGAQFLFAALDEALVAQLACAFDPSLIPTRLDRQYTAGARGGLDYFRFAAAGQALYFLLFTGLRGVTDIIHERRQGTLQRLIVMPFPRYYILLGKLCGTFVNCLIQLILLYLAFSAMNSLLKGQFQPVWGSDLASIGLVMLAASFAASGLGMLVMSVARTPQQADALAGSLGTFLAALGGALFPIQDVPILSTLAALTPTYWGTDAFYRLASGQGEITLHLAALLGMGIVLFAVGAVLFSRQREA